MHVRAALRNGLTRDEIGEVLLHAAVYAGVPAANRAPSPRARGGVGRVHRAQGDERPMTEAPTEHPERRRTADFVQSLERGLAVIRAFDADAPASSPCPTSPARPA